MAAMKKDVNLGLLLLIVAALLMFSGFTVYYQTTFKNLSNTYQQELEALEKITNDLESKKSQLNETSVQLQLRKQKEEDLSKKYVDTKGERDQLETDKKKLEVDLAGTKSSLAATTTELTKTQGQLASYIQLATDLNRQVTDLKREVDSYKADYERYKSKYECVANKVDANGQAC